MSNTLFGRGLLVLAALLLILGLLALRFWPQRRVAPEIAPTHVAEASEAPAVELVPASPPAPEPRADSDELEPFTPVRSSGENLAGKYGSLRGHVEVEGEEAFPRAWKLVLRPSLTLPAREYAEVRVLTFEDGRQDFEVHDLPLGGYDVAADAPGFNGQVLPVALRPGSEDPFVNLRMVSAGWLEGRVLDSTGVPAEAIPITIFSVPENETREAVTDSAGLFRFDKVSDGTYELLVGKAEAPVLRERRPLRFLAPSLTLPDITLPALGEIRLRVVDSLERPLEGCEVRGSGTNGGTIEGKTDYDGRLDAKHLPAGHFRLRVWHPGFDEKYARRVAVDVEAGKATEAPIRLGP